MNKYLWIILFFVTTLCFAQTNAAINQASTDNNLVIQLVDSKLVNLDNKVVAVAQSNQDGIADLKARTDEKLADKFKQLDDKGVYVGWWMSILGLLLTFFGLMTPLGAFLLNRKIDKNIKESQELLDKEIKKAVDQVKNKLEAADRLLIEMNGFHRNAEISASEIQDLANKSSSGSLTPEDSQKLKNDSNDLKNIPESQLTANDWFIRGLNAQDQKEYYEAITYYNFAIKLNPKIEECYINRGIAKYNLQQYDAAIKDYDQAIELNPHDATYYSERGVIKVKIRRYEESIKDYNEAIELDPKNVGAYFNKACAYALMKNKPEALNWLDKALQLAYPVNEVLDDGDWKIYLDDPDFEDLITKYNK